jgi:hypothetical protein
VKVVVERALLIGFGLLLVREHRLDARVAAR